MQLGQQILMHDQLLLLVSLIAWMLVCAAVAKLAASLHRPPATWFLLARLLSPVIAAVLLIFIGDPEQARELREKEACMRQRHPGRTDVREAVLNEMQCPHCGATVNPITQDGLHSSEAKPWLLICDQCEGTIELDA